MSYFVPGKRPFTVLCCALCCLGLTAVLPLSAVAQEEEASAAWECDVYGRYEPARSAKASEGDVEIFESGAEVSLEKKFFGRLPVTFSIASEYMGIDETTTLGLPSHLTGVSFDAETTLPFTLLDKTYLRVGVTPSFYRDDWDYESSAFRIPVRAFLINLPNERLTLLAGVAVYPDYENEVMPILGFIYKPNDRLTFEITPKKPQVSYLLTEKITGFLEAGGGMCREFEVTRGDAHNVVLRYKETRLGAGLRLRPNPFIEAGISAGGAFNRTFKYRDNAGKLSIKDGAYFEFRLKISI